MWKYKSGYFTNLHNGKVFTVSGKRDVEAQPVWAVNRYRGRDSSQVWKIVYTHQMGDEAYKKKGQTDSDFGFVVDETFFFRSKLPMQRVAECVGASNVTLKKWYKNRRA
jgi:hypothetical protein